MLDEVLFMPLQKQPPLMFFKIGVPKSFTNITEKHLCWSLPLNKVAGLKACNFIKKRLQHRCLPVKFAKFLRTPFFTEYLLWLLLNGNFSLVRLHNNKNQHYFFLFLPCFKYIFDSSILFPELVVQRKHYLFGFDAIQFFL